MSKAPKLQKERKKRAPDPEFACIDINRGKLVYDYAAGLLGEHTARRFEEHLLLCFHCQDVVLTMDDVFDTLAQNKEAFFSRPGLQESKELCAKTLRSKLQKRNRS